MKKTIKIASVLALTLSFNTFAQEEFNVEIEPVVITNSPAIHSFAFGQTTDEKWVIVGGRMDGLHQRQPFAAFQENDNNKNVFVVDPISNQTYSASLSVLPTSIYEQLQSTNQEFYQRNNTLYVIGGYGYSTTADEHLTYANLTAIDIDGLSNAVINGNSILPYFRQIEDSLFAVTGGQIGYLDSVFYLAGGQYFEGRYNPMGPNNGPGFIQEYTDEVRLFKLSDDGTSLTVYEETEFYDQTNLHRRDYNMIPQIFPNGDKGFTMYSGVFDPNDLPYLNSVDVTESAYTVNNSFTQYLSQYHSAKIPVFDINSNAMHTLFFGGMSQYTLDANNALVQDDDVPFVKTISKVTRLTDGSMQEVKLNIEMPTLLGAGAEFIPLISSGLYLDDEILDINAVPNSKTLIGYIVGGIESTLPNIFFINDGTQSSASNVVFKVYINKSTVGLHEQVITGSQVFNLNVFPNPVINKVNVDFFVPDNNPVMVNVYNSLGQSVYQKNIENQIGKQNLTIDFENMAKGAYIVKIEGTNYSFEQSFIKK
ncbi:MAG TPA: T9SS type A sorting domain-containing protein [Crocinitomix sp.]|nr:T9SS type A sorting domain-containing protein [Crocinitomix sp.]